MKNWVWAALTVAVALWGLSSDVEARNTPDVEFHFSVQPVGGEEEPVEGVYHGPSDTVQVPLPKVYSDVGWACVVEPEKVLTGPLTSGRVARNVVCEQNNGALHTRVVFGENCRPRTREEHESDVMLAVKQTGVAVGNYHLTISCKSGGK